MSGEPDMEFVGAPIKASDLERAVMAIDDAQKTDESPGAVSRRVSDVIMDIYHGRTTPQQNRAIGVEVERSGRVKPGADKAVGKAVGGG